MKKFNIVIFTIARSDFGILKNIIKKIELDQRFNLDLMVGAAHYSKTFGSTLNEIKDINIKNLKKIKFNYKNSSNLDVVEYFKETMSGVSKILNKKKVDALILLGDRYEALAAAMTSFQLNIPIFHLCGGSITEGSLDDTYRYCISKMSTIHFLETNDHKKNLIKLNIKKNLFVIGSPSLENYNKDLINKNDFELKYNYKFKKSKNILVCCFNPETTLSIKKNINKLDMFIKFLNQLDQNIIFTYPNSDQGYLEYIRLIKKKLKKKNILVVKNLGKKNYFSLLNFANIVIGNSSSGIIETGSFKIPTINLGDRQKKRVCNNNIIHSKFNLISMRKAYKVATSKKFIKKMSRIKNIYYQKKTSENFINISYNFLKKTMTIL